MFQIRKAKAEDQEPVHQVRKAAWKVAYSGILPDYIISEATSDEILKRPFDVTTRTFLVAQEDQTVIGFAAGGAPRDIVDEMDCEIWAIYVNPKSQGQQVGSQLVKKFKEEMLAQGKSRMGIWTLKENYSARSFYEKLNGELSEQEKEFKWNGQPVAKEVAYIWDLKAGNI